jgi:hypothetical protein
VDDIGRSERNELRKAQTPAQQLATAYLWVAEANHYMVGVIHPFNETLWDEAEQILITDQNDLGRKIRSKDLYESLYARYDLALDILQHGRNTKRREG